MIIYEVNLKIQAKVYDAYFAWLKPHIDDMLHFKGFQSARVLKEQRLSDQDFQNITVQYEINTMADLDDYLDNNAQAMRDDGLKRFANQYQATRRFFSLIEE